MYTDLFFRGRTRTVVWHSSKFYCFWSNTVNLYERNSQQKQISPASLRAFISFFTLLLSKYTEYYGSPEGRLRLHISHSSVLRDCTLVIRTSNHQSLSTVVLRNWRSEVWICGQCAIWKGRHIGKHTHPYSVERSHSCHWKLTNELSEESSGDDKYHTTVPTVHALRINNMHI